MTTKHICLFGGPGTGKSTTSHGLMYQLKSAGYKAEYIHEYAKDLTYAEDKYRLSDQLYILAKQHHPWTRLHNLQYTVNDGPFLQGLVYNKEGLLQDLTLSLYRSYDTLNILLERDITHHPYQTYGRSQSLSEALQLDMDIKNMLLTNKIPFTTIKVGPSAVEDIYLLLQESP